MKEKLFCLGVSLILVLIVVGVFYLVGLFTINSVSLVALLPVWLLFAFIIYAGGQDVKYGTGW